MNVNPIDLAMTAQEFGQWGKEWVESSAAVLNAVIGQVGILGLAAIGVWKSLSQKAELKAQIEDTKQEISKRLDNQAQRINDVAIAASPAGNGNPIIDHPEQVEIKP